MTEMKAQWSIEKWINWEQESELSWLTDVGEADAPPFLGLGDGICGGLLLLTHFLGLGFGFSEREM